MKKRKKNRKFIIGLTASLLLLAVLVGMFAGNHLWENSSSVEKAAQENFKAEEDSKFQESQRAEENAQFQESQKTEENAQSQESMKAEESVQSQESMKTEESAQSQESRKSAEELLQEQVQEKLDAMSLEEKAAQLFIITPEALTGYSSVTQAGETTRASLQRYPVGGLIFFEGNIQSEQQVTEMLQKQQAYSKERIGLPLFTGIDEEGGQVTRIASCSGIAVQDFPDIAQIGAGGDSSQAYELGDTIGEYLSRMGFNLDFAPVADVLTNPDNTVVKRRSYGSDPQNVSHMVRSNLEGLQKHQVYGCIKHFPGHGATQGDTHQGYSHTDKSWEELKSSDLIPFVDSIKWGVDFVMVGHISLPQVTGNDVPASLSSYIISDLLRGEIGYDGIVLTDALNMKAVTDQYTSSQAAVKTILAGGDMILMPLDFTSAYEGILDALEDGTITEKRLDESVARILRVKLKMQE